MCIINIYALWSRELKFIIIILHCLLAGNIEEVLTWFSTFAYSYSSDSNELTCLLTLKVA